MITHTEYNQHFFSFLTTATSPFHATLAMAQQLGEHGFHRLFEHEDWQLKSGNSYYIIRDNAALIAFTLGKKEQRQQGFRIVGAHTDSPALQIKPAMKQKGTTDIQRLGVEIYGGALLSTWFDRDLSLSGRVCVLQEGAVKSYLIDFARPLLTIPSLAIHLDREANNGGKIDKQLHLSPIFMQGEKENFITLLAEQLRMEYPNCDKNCTITGFDLFCHDSQPPALTGAKREFISAGRLDNLLSCFAGLQAITADRKERNTLLFCANHEENGSLSTSGADGNFLEAVLQRLLPEREKFYRAMANSFCISADNAHANHPAYPEKRDADHAIALNYGPVIKYNANQRYATNGQTAAIFSAICRGAKLTPQKFVMRSDMPCGSTIGPMTAARLGIKTVDIGAATLAMHSIREFTGALDPWLCYQAIREFYQGDYHRSLLI